MSDARKVNRAITGYLQQVLGEPVRDSHIHALAMTITGLLRGKSCHFEKIGSKSKYPSRVKQIQRLNKNPHISYESLYLPFIEQVISSLGLPEYRLSIDTSQVGRCCLDACRTAKNNKVRAHKNVEAHSLVAIAPPAGQSRQINQLYFTQKDVRPVNIAFIWHKEKEEHIYLVTSFFYSLFN